MADLEPGQARIRHPEVGESVVPASAVEHWKRAGWTFVEGDAEQWPVEAQQFGGQQQVRIRHPITGGESIVAESAVPHWRSVGWLVVDAHAEAEATAGLEHKTVPELRELARDRGLKPIPATKPELVAALGDQPATEQNQVADQAGDEPADHSEEES
jgi:hypothetical protein